MNRIKVRTKTRRLLADVYTPAGIYLRVRDRFRDTILLESTDHHVAHNSYSFICINAIAGIEVSSADSIDIKYPSRPPERKTFSKEEKISSRLTAFVERFEVEKGSDREAAFAQGLYGYMSYDSKNLFDKGITIARQAEEDAIPLIRYRLFQYVIAIDHFKDEMIVCENVVEGVESEISLLDSLIRSRNVPSYPFLVKGEERSNMNNEQYMDMVRKGVQSCHRGDVFQIVLSRRFEQSFIGDEFNVYRSLRNINPSPYLFYFDYGDYRIMGSSPEAQLIVRNGKATLHPIAGTFRRSGDDDTDHKAAELLLADRKENAEHVMLVDLARNDLSMVCNEVVVERMKEIKYYSHVIHMVSEVTGKVSSSANVFDLLSCTFPAGTISGAPKIKAMELISKYEPTARGYYGGAIGFIGFDGSCNHAIMIRSFLSRNNTLVCQAGAGIVAGSDPVKELDEVNNKLGALKKAITMAEKINKD